MKKNMIDYSALEGVFDKIAALQIRVEEQMDLIEALTSRLDSLEWLASDD